MRALILRTGLLLLMLLVALPSPPLLAAPPGKDLGIEPGIEMDVGDHRVTLSRSQLLQRSDVTKIQIPGDITYKRAMTYRAVPLAALLRDASLTPDAMAGDMLEIVASDGFVTLLPSALVFPKDKAASVPYLAVEPPTAPWPPIPGKTVSAGPFYVVWLDPGASGIRSEQWPYMVERIRAAESPERRWPQLAVDPSLPADSPIRAGEALFFTQCMVCHTLNGAGSAHVGPDLNLPQNPTEYFQPKALRQLIRNPASVRSWPDMQMKGFDQQALSDHEIALIIQYLTHMAGRKSG